MQALTFSHESSPRRVLRLSRFHFDQVLEAHAAVEGRNTVWSARVREQPISASHTLLSGELRSDSLMQRPERWTQEQRAGEVGLLIVARLSSTELLDLQPALWVAQCAPAWRLHSPVDRPSLTLLRFTDDGRLAGHHLDRISPAAWATLDRVDLPGAEMMRVPVNPTAALAQAGDAPPKDSNGRFSRAEFAFGSASFARWQESRFAIIGVGRIGSTVAHTLVRQGASVVLVDADRVELHNCDGDVLPVHEGLRKVDAVSRFIRGCARAGARVEGIAMAVADASFARYMGDVDAIISTTDNFAARSVVSDIAVRHLIPHLDVGTRIVPDGAEAELRLIVPGDGCLHCLGGLGDDATLKRNVASEARRSRMLNLGFSPKEVEDPSDFRSERLGSSRAWGTSAGHLGLRMLEAMYRGRLRTSLFQRVEEHDGRWGAVARHAGRVSCAYCRSK